MYHAHVTCIMCHMLHVYASIFQVADKDNGGTVDEFEMQIVLNSANLTIREEYLFEKVDRIDPTGRREFSFRQMVQLIAELLVEGNKQVGAETWRTFGDQRPAPVPWLPMAGGR